MSHESIVRRDMLYKASHLSIKKRPFVVLLRQEKLQSLGKICFLLQISALRWKKLRGKTTHCYQRFKMQQECQ